MEIKDVAKAILDRRNCMTPIVMSGEMRNALGQEGYAQALQRGWLQPNYESGELSVTNQQAVINDIRKMAEAVDEPQIGDAVKVGEEGDTFDAVIAGKDERGQYKLSFGEKKPRNEKAYMANELNVVKKAVPPGTTPDQAAKPAPTGYTPNRAYTPTTLTR